MPPTAGARPGPADSPGFLAAGGAMGALMRAHPWRETPLGQPDLWPQALKTTIRLMLTARHPMFVFWGEHLTCLYNDAYSELIGPDRHPAALGRPGADVWREIWDVIGPEIDTVRSGRGATWDERKLIPITRGDRVEDVWWTYSYSPIDHDAAPNGIGGVLVICRDVSAEVRAAEAQALEAERLRQLFEQSPGFMAVTRGPDHVFELTNPALLQLVGRDLVGRSMREAIPELERQGYLELIDHVFRTGEPFTARSRPVELATPPAGPGSPAVAHRFVDFVFQPIRDSGGRTTGVFIQGSDVTQATLDQQALRRSEADLKQANATLEQRVAERTAAQQASEERLRQSQKMEAVGQLTGGIAHDFNNMLQAIEGSLELMARRIAQGRAEETGRFVDAAQKTVRRAAALTNRLLAFSRRQALQPEPITIDALVKGMAELLQGTLGATIAIQLRLIDGVWPVLCDPNQLENGLLNIGINARDAMPAGGTLTITTQHVTFAQPDMPDAEGATPGDFVEISVHDTGTGMDDATRLRAFEPFFTTKPVGQGTGLGLSQLYGFAGQSGGFVRLDSAPDHGTTVRLYLPRHRPDGGPAPAASARFPASCGQIILLVEDDETVRAMTMEHLQDAGYQVVAVGDGPGALERLRAGTRFDALVTDVGLPGGMNGRQIADAAREFWPGLPVLFITGYAGTALESQLAPGMGLIGKPFSLEALSARLRAALARPTADPA